MMTTQKRKVDSSVRDDFPILDLKIQNKRFAYLDSGVTSLKPKSVCQAVANYDSNISANIHRAVYTTGELATRAFEDTRERVRHFLNAKSTSEIVFTSGTTMGINFVARSFGEQFVKPGDEILITQMEHHSNIVPWQMLCQRTGATLKYVPLLPNGDLDLAALDQLLTHKTKLFAFVHISNALGSINPIESLIQKAKQVGAATLIDAAQSIAHLPIDVQNLDCDFLVFSGHKCYGPTGCGVLFAKQKWLDAMPPMFGGGDMVHTVTLEKTTYAAPPAKFEAGTPAISSIIGLGAAIDYMSTLDFDSIATHDGQLLQELHSTLRDFKEVTIIGTSKLKSSIVSFVVDGIHPHDLGTLLDSEGVAVRAGHHCAQPIMQFFNVPATVRASAGIYTHFQDVYQLAQGLHKIIKLFS